jgi:hypothetical protein
MQCVGWVVCVGDASDSIRSSIGFDGVCVCVPRVAALHRHVVQLDVSWGSLVVLAAGSVISCIYMPLLPFELICRVGRWECDNFLL